MFSNEEKSAIIATSRALASMPRFDHASDFRVPPVSRHVPEPEPQSHRLTDSEIARLARDTSEELAGFQRYVGDELSALLTTVFNSIGDEFEKVNLDLKGLQNKSIEGDITDLRAEVATLKSDNEKLRQAVEAISNQVAQLADDFSSIERAAGGRVVAIR